MRQFFANSHWSWGEQKFNVLFFATVNVFLALSKALCSFTVYFSCFAARDHTITANMQCSSQPSVGEALVHSCILAVKFLICTGSLC